MAVLSPVQPCASCSVAVRLADAGGGQTIPVEIGTDRPGDPVAVDKANTEGRLLARIVAPGEELPRTSARLTLHRCTPQQRRPADPTPAEIAAMPDDATSQRLQLRRDNPEAWAIANLLDAGFTVEIIKESPCMRGCGRTVQHKPKDSPVCPDCQSKRAGKTSRR